MNSVFLLLLVPLCLFIPQLRLWVIPLMFALYTANPVLCLLAGVLIVGALLAWRIFK